MNVGRMPQAVGLGGEESVVDVGWAEGDRRHAIEAVDLRPVRPAICRAVESAEPIGWASPTTKDAHIPGVLRRIGRIDHDVLRPIMHAGIRDIGPGAGRRIVNEHAGTRGKADRGAVT